MGNFLTNFIKQKVLICIIFTLCLVAGIISFINIPIDAFPDLTNNQVQILTESPGMAPLEVEQLVTIPIEATINGLPKIEIVRSISKLGLSVVTVVFKDDVDIYFARQLVNERLQTARARLPQDLNPQLGPVTTGMGEIYQYVIEGNGYSATDLKTLHDWEIKYQLRTVPGVNEVNTWGGQTLEYQITLYPNKMLQYHLTLKEVFDALKNNNENFSGGIVEHVSEQYVVRGVGLVKNLDDLRNIMIKYQDGNPIYIRNVATVEYGQALRQGATTKDGKGEVVTGIIMMLKGENSRIVIHRVKNKIEEISKTLPESVRIKPYYDQTLLIEQTLETVEKNLFEGSMLVIAVLLLMLGNLRASLIVTLTIPLSLMFSFMGMKALGISANIMSLGALDFGMIVDGSIYMVENIMLRLHTSKDSNLTTFEIIQRAMREMTKPIFFGVLIITTVYMPILSLEGMEYKMFSPMVFAVCFALLGSLLIALILVPVLCSIFLSKDVVEKKSII
ncbi:MAG: efflux RND transporter permease subunit, partial [bacterium]